MFFVFFGRAPLLIWRRIWSALVALSLLVGCGSERGCNSFAHGRGAGPSFRRGPQKPWLRVGETKVIWTPFETGVPFGTALLHPSVPGATGGMAPLSATVSGLETLTLPILYYRGAGHVDENSGHVRMESPNGGRTWPQAGSEITVQASEASIATTACTVASNVSSCDVSSGHNIVVGDRVYTTGLSVNRAIDNPTNVSGTTATSISYPLTASDGAMADGVGTIERSAAVRGPALQRFSTGRIGMLYNTFDEDSATSPQRTTFYRYSDDEQVTWSLPVRIPNQCTNWQAAGKSMLELPSGRLGATVYCQNTGESRYISYMMEAPNLDGASWTQRGVIAQHASPTGLQYEAPVCRYRPGATSNEILCLIREDTTGRAQRVWSDDDAVTFTSPEAVFFTRAIPRWVQTANGTIVAMASRDGDANDRPPHLYYSRDGGTSFSGPTHYFPAQPDGDGDQQEGDVVEVAPNIVGVFTVAQRLVNESCYMGYTEVGVGASPPRSAYRPTSTAFFDSSGTVRHLNYGSTAWFNAQQQFTAIGWFRRDQSLGANQHFLSKNGASQLHFRWMISSTNAFEARIASSLTAESVCTTNVTIANTVAYYYAIRYLGTCSPSTDCDTNAERLRVWVCSDPASCSEATCTFSGTVPAQLTSPNSTAVTWIGNHSLSTTQQLRDMRLSTFGIWPVAIAPSTITGAVYNESEPQSHAELAAIIGSNATIFLPFSGDYNDERGTLPAPTVTGPISHNSRWAP